MVHPMADVAVVGPGSVGSFFAAQLIAAGASVLSCARRPFDRYVIESDHPTLEVPADVVTDPADAGGPVPWVLLTVKAHQTESARPWLERLCGPETRLVVIQKGVEQEERGRAVANGAAVIPSVVYCAAELLDPGHVRHHASSSLHVPIGADAESLAHLLAPTVCTVHPAERWSRAAWFKLGMNVAVNGITALTLRRLDVLREPGVDGVVRRILTECWTVADAEGAGLGPDDVPSAADGLLANASATGGTSMFYDRSAGRPLEYDALYGAVVRAGRRHGIPTPLHDTLAALLAAVPGRPAPPA
jgi:2-dehydropantoate 2-reductase